MFVFSLALQCYICVSLSYLSRFLFSFGQASTALIPYAFLSLLTFVDCPRHQSNLTVFTRSFKVDLVGETVFIFHILFHSSALIFVDLSSMHFHTSLPFCFPWGLWDLIKVSHWGYCLFQCQWMRFVRQWKSRKTTCRKILILFQVRWATVL